MGGCMEKNLLALFGNAEQADSAVIELARRGYRQEDMSVIASDTSMASAIKDDSPGERVAEGATSGAVLGGLAGLLAGAGVVPALAGVLIGGPFAAALGLTGLAAAAASGAITGGLAGGLVGALSNFGLSKEQAHEFSEGVNQGGVVLALPVNEANQDEATQVLQDAGAQRVHLASDDLSKGAEQIDTTEMHSDEPAFLAHEVHKDQTFKSKDISGKRVISYVDGKELYRIHDVIHDAINQKVLGFMVDESWLLARGRHIPLSAVRSIGKDAVTVDSEAVVHRTKDDREIDRVTQRHLDIRRHKIVTEDGEVVGRVTDFYFNGETGNIEGYDISRGFGDDAYKGIAYLSSANVAKVGEDVVFVRREAGDFINDQQTGGLYGAIEQAKGKTRETASAARSTFTQGQYGPEFMQGTVTPALDNVTEKAASTWDKIKEQINEMKEQSSRSHEEKRIKEALGRPVTRVILDTNDNVILNTGDLITHEAIERAREHNMLDALLDSVYKDNPDFTKDELRASDEEKM